MAFINDVRFEVDKRAILARLKPLLPAQAILVDEEELRPYECDGLTAYRATPLLVVLPETEAQVADILRACHALKVPVVPRGAATGLSGGAMPHEDGVVLSLARFKKIRNIEPLSRTAVVQPGVRNLAVSEATAAYGLYYAPDPSSQIACTIGGNVAENSGGVHCLKYGLTVHNVLKVRGFTIEGEAVEFGADGLDAAGFDLLAIMNGSEGLLAVITEVTVKLTPKPELAQVVLAYFDDVQKAGNAVADVIAAGIIPGGLEMMDKKATHAVEPYVKAGYDLDAEAVLLCESDGTPAEVAEEIERMKAVLEKSGATSLVVSQNEADRLRFWAGGRTHHPGLHVHGWHHSPQAPSRDAGSHRNPFGQVRPALRQRLPRRRRQPAPADHV
jgi:glycolate oxidase